MRKSYLWMLSLVFSLFTGLSSYAGDITIKVNDEGIGVLQFKDLSSEGSITTITQNVTTISNFVAGNLIVADGYTMDVTNESTGSVIGKGVTEQQIHGGFVQPGQTVNVVVTEAGGGGDDPVQKYVYVVFSPVETCANAGYVVLTDNDTQEETTYRPEDGEIKIPYDAISSFKIMPNPGYFFVECLNETQHNSNPNHTFPISPSLNGGFSWSMGGTVGEGETLVVTCSKKGSFKVKGIGKYVSEIYFCDNNSSTPIVITEEFQEIALDGQVEYTIRSKSAFPIYTVNVTNDSYTTSLSGISGSFSYTPQDGDEVVIDTDTPVQDYHFKISYKDYANKNLVNEVQYNYQIVAEDSWQAVDGWNTTGFADCDLTIGFNYTGFQNVMYKVNNGEWLTPSYTTIGSTSGYFAKIVITESDYDIVISAEKEQPYSVTIKTNIADGFTIHKVDGYNLGTAYPFSYDGQSISVAPSSNRIKFVAKSGYKITGYLLDGEDPENAFYDNYFTVDKDCEITVNVLNMTELRTKTAVVYLEPKSWGSKTFELGDRTPVNLKNGYNYIKYCDEDRPFNVSAVLNIMAENNTTTYYLNDVKYDFTQLPNQLINYQEGDILKIYSAEQTPAGVTYAIHEDFADFVEIVHDHATPVKASEWNGTVLPGTEIELTIKDETPAEARKYTRSGDIEPYADQTKPYVVKVNDEEIQPNNKGVYAVTVGEETKIAVEKSTPSGLTDIDAIDSDSFTIFNLQGVAVKKNADKNDLRALPAGIYVAGGKKVIVK